MVLAFDAASNGVVNANTLTISHTITGNQPVLYYGVGDITGTGAWHITGVTFNGVAMTEITHSANAGGIVAGLFEIINPASGTHNVVITSSTVDFLKAAGASYTGADQTTQPDSFNVGIVDPGTSITESTNVVKSNCWLLSFIADASGLAMSAGSGVNSVRTNTSDHVAYIGDSNGTVAPGSQSQTWTSSSQSIAMVIASISPFPSSAQEELSGDNMAVMAQRRFYKKAVAEFMTKAKCKFKDAVDYVRRESGIYVQEKELLLPEYAI